MIEDGELRRWLETLPKARLLVMASGHPNKKKAVKHELIAWMLKFQRPNVVNLYKKNQDDLLLDVLEKHIQELGPVTINVLSDGRLNMAWGGWFPEMASASTLVDLIRLLVPKDEEDTAS